MGAGRRILLIGGSGFLSGTLARTAVDAGHTVWAVTRGTRPLPQGVTGITVDRRDRAAFRSAIEQTSSDWDMVVDVCAYHPDDALQDIEVFRQRTKQLVFISTDFVYDPEQRRLFQSPDNHDHQDVYTTAGYGADKRAGELQFYREDTGDMAWTILRPGHIYGPGSLLGCLPMHSRDEDLLTTLRAGKPLTLVGGGHFLQQPVLAADLASIILRCCGHNKTHYQAYNATGPDIVESWRYYQIVADILDVHLTIEELPIAPFLEENPGREPFLCHRVYDTTKLHAHGLAPATPIAEGLRQHVEALQRQE